MGGVGGRGVGGVVVVWGVVGGGCGRGVVGLGRGGIVVVVVGVVVAFGGVRA